MRAADGEVRAHFRALAEWLAETPAERLAEKRLVSFDSTMRSNLSVGLTIDLLGYEKDRLRVSLKRRVFAEAPDVSWS